MNPEKRLTATQVREQLKAIIDSHNGVRNTDHLVPEFEMNIEDNTPQTPPSDTPFNEKWKKVSCYDMINKCCFEALTYH